MRQYDSRIPSLSGSRGGTVAREEGRGYQPYEQDQRCNDSVFHYDLFSGVVSAWRENEAVSAAGDSEKSGSVSVSMVNSATAVLN